MMKYEFKTELLLREFRDRVKAGDVQFLKDADERTEVLKQLTKLQDEIHEAASKAKESKRDFTETLNWHDAQIAGNKLWRALASAALRAIDPDSKGNSRLFEFLDSAISFEDLLYGLEDYYRDHTLHSIWVYLIGDSLLRNPLQSIYESPNWYAYNDIERDERKNPGSYRAEVVTAADEKVCRLNKAVSKRKDAIWCLMALCHDLGYSLEKLNKLNDKVFDVLRFIELPEFSRVGYSLDVEQQYITAQFLELMAMDVRVVPADNCDDIGVDAADCVRVMCYRDDSSYWRLCRAMEKKQHGILSAYLVFKLLGVFADTWVRGTGEQWGLDEEEAEDNLIRGNILYAMAQHTFDFAYLGHLGSFADILVLADEIEEHSRYGRPLLSRRYYDTVAEPKVSFSPSLPETGQDVDVTIEYKVMRADELDGFFVRKANALCRMYSLRKEPELDSRSCCIRSIKMVARYSKRRLQVVLQRDSKYHRITTPARRRTKKTGQQYVEHQACCRDDKLYIISGKTRTGLKKWLEALKPRKKQKK